MQYIRRFIRRNRVFIVVLLVVIVACIGFALRHKFMSQPVSGLFGDEAFVRNTMMPTTEENKEENNKDNNNDTDNESDQTKPSVVTDPPKRNEDGTIDCYIYGKTKVEELPESSIKDLADSIDKNPESMTVLINKLYPVDSDYRPDDLRNVDVNFGIYYEDEKRMLRDEAASALEQMFETAENEGYELIGVSGFRSFQRQKTIYNNNLVYKGYDHTNKYSARPGRSEHQTGWAMDLSCQSANGDLISKFIETPEGTWVKENCYRFGYIVRYPKGKEDITGYAYEPWHVRYVGYDLAKYLHDNDLTLEEYYSYEPDLEVIEEQEREYYEELLGIGYEPTYVPMDEPIYEETPTPQTTPPAATISPTPEPQTEEPTKESPTKTPKPQTDKPTKSPTRKPATTKPATEAPVTTKPPTKKPATKTPKPQTEAPTKKPATESPATVPATTKPPIAEETQTPPEITEQPTMKPESGTLSTTLPLEK